MHTIFENFRNYQSSSFLHNISLLFCHYIAEILMKVALSTINQPTNHYFHHVVTYLISMIDVIKFLQYRRQIKILCMDMIEWHVWHLLLLMRNSWQYFTWHLYHLNDTQGIQLMLWIRFVHDTTLCDKVYQWLAAGQWFSPGSPASSTNKTDRLDITEILLKVALSTIILSFHCIHDWLIDWF